MPNKSPESAPIAATFDDAGKEVVPDNGHGGHERRICGMKRRTFFIVATIVAVVVIAAIVGGVVGGLKAGKKSDGDDAPGDAPEPIFTGPIGAKERQLAVTNSNLLTMVGDDVAKNGWTDAVLQKGDDAAFPGSYFQVVGPEEDEINAWYVVKKGGRMKHFSYRDVLGPKSNRESFPLNSPHYSP